MDDIADFVASVTCARDSDDTLVICSPSNTDLRGTMPAVLRIESVTSKTIYLTREDIITVIAALHRLLTETPH